MMQLTGEEPLSLACLNWSISTALPFGLRNAVATASHHIAWSAPPPPTDSEFVGMADYHAESIHDLLASDSGSIYDSTSSWGSYDPARECFMAGTTDDADRELTLKGAVQDVSDGNETHHHPDNGGEDVGRVGAELPPHELMEQLIAQQQELETARLRLEEERAALEEEILRCHERVCARGREAHRRIVEDDGGLPRFARASQNIAAMTALLRGLSKQATPEAWQAQWEIHMMFERSVTQ